VFAHFRNTSPKNAGDTRGTSDRFTLRFVKT
jgi:predicted methyltransferase